jgi:protein arginine N-methyltransferase 3
MGYALLYESMLDSVLHTYDRFSKPEGGVMALSQCRIMSKLYEGRKILKDRVRCLRCVPFRIALLIDVYPPPIGFDLSVMAHDVYDEAIINIVSPDSLTSQPYLLKDLHLTPRATSTSPPPSH